MIRHRPFGSGHPYVVDTDQRSPVHPVTIEQLRIGARIRPDAVAARVELSCGPGETQVYVMERTSATSRGRAIDGGHLASAQARLARASGGWQVTVDDLRPYEAYRYRILGEHADGHIESTRWFDFTVSAWRDAVDVLTVDGRNRIVPGSVRVLDDRGRARRVRFALQLSDGEHVVGFGERFDALDHRGQALDSVVFEQYKSQGAERKTYLPMPFAHVVGGSGWGFHIKTSRRVWFDVGATQTDRIWVEAEVDAEADATDLLTVATYDGTPAAVLDAFVNDVGRPEELPAWVFRLWASGNEWNTQAEVMRQADLHREHGIALGSVVIEAWSDERTFTIWRDAEYKVNAAGSPMRYSDFQFPVDGAWPDPKGMVDELHGRDVRVLLWQIPLLKMRPHPTGQARADVDAAIHEDVLIRELDPNGRLRPYRNRGWWFPLALMPDLTDERAATWWTDKRRYLVEDIGIDGFKTDGGEHAWGADLRYLDGTHGDAGNNTFPVYYAKAYGDLLRSAGKAPVTFSRAGFTGSQAHGAFWAGDENSTWEAFRWSMFAGLSAAACGIVYWGWDLAGFSGDVPDAELYLRSVAAATFVPIMQYHSEFNHHRTPSRDRTPWNIAERTGDDRVIPVFRTFVELRERLVPYLADSAREAVMTGAPLMRPLFFDYGDDDAIWDHPLQWTLGRDILVTPVLEPGVAEVESYLPRGEWVDAFSGESVTGGRTIRRAVPVDELPVYVRAAAWDALRSVFATT